MDRPPLVRPPGAGPADPHQVHLTLASGGGVWVSWATGDGSVGGGDRPPPRLASVVQFGQSAAGLGRTARGASETYTQAFPGGESYTSPRLHHVHLSAADLEASGKEGAAARAVFYRVGDPGPGGAWSPVRAFTPPPRAGLGAYPVRLAVLGDLGQTHNSSTTLDHLTAAARGEPAAGAAVGGAGGGGVAAASTTTTTAAPTPPPAQAVFYLGDMTYADDYNPDGTLRAWPAPPLPYTPSYGPKWDAWGRFTEGLFSAVPAVTTAGNHEIETDAAGRSFQAWRARYKSGPGKGPAALASTAPLYGSVDVGPVHIISLNTYAPWDPASAQRAWLEADLRGVDRSATPWVFVLMHAPWYSSYASHYRELECMRLELEGVLAAGSVDAVFSGHVHAYERTSRVLDGVPQPDVGGCAPRYVVAGDGGNLERLYTVFTSGPGPAACPPAAAADECGQAEAAAAAADPANNPPFCDATQPRWSMLRQPAYGFGMLDVLSPTRARWSWYANVDGRVRLADSAEWSRDEACLSAAGRAAADARAGARGTAPNAAERADAADAAPPPAAGYAPPPPAELPSQLAAAARAGVAPPPP